MGFVENFRNLFAKKKCHFCGGGKQFQTYTDGKDTLKVCHLCEDYASRRAFRKV